MTWLLSETESNQVWIADCGDVELIIEKIEGREIVGVLLTHVTNLPKGDKYEAQESMLKILKLAEGKRILPGHYVRDEK